LRETIQFLIEHGYSLLFFWVLAEQLGIPIPAAPILLAAGALSGIGHMNLALTLLLSVIASLASDVIWYEFGRRKGAVVLNLLCRIALEPDSCVRRTESVYERNGARSLLFAKFVPGLSTVAPPVAGIFRMHFGRFLLFDLLGSLLWSGAFIGVGYVFADQLEIIALRASRFGTWLILIMSAALIGYIFAKWRERKRFMRTLAEDRISAEAVFQKLESGEPLAIVDLRHPLDFLPDPRVLPGAIRMAPDELDARHDEIPRDREIILYCT
jgi:membrane protein DedA with SNARE-associated domain